MPHATWRPEYDFSFRPKASHGVGPGRYRLWISALVRQASGEDWKAVKMRLSTARPRLAADAPRPAPFKLQARSKSRAQVLATVDERRDRRRRGTFADTEAASLEVGVERRGQTVLLEVSHPVDIPSDGRERYLPVAEVVGAAEVRLVAVPTKARSVFQEVRLRSHAPFPISPGRVRVYRGFPSRAASEGGLLVGRTRLPSLASGQEHRLSLGEDSRFRVRREDLNDYRKMLKNFRRTHRFERAFRTTVEGSAGVELPVEVRQQIPVARNRDIKVKLNLEKSSRGTSFDAIRGHVFNTLGVPPGGHSSADLYYEVRVPEDWKVGG